MDIYFCIQPPPPPPEKEEEKDRKIKRKRKNGEWNYDYNDFLMWYWTLKLFLSNTGDNVIL